MEMPIRKLRELGISIYLTRIIMDFKKGIQLEEIITVDSSVIELNKVSSLWKHEIFNSENQLCNTAIVKGVFVKDGKPSRLSKEIYEHFLKYKKED